MVSVPTTLPVTVPPTTPATVLLLLQVPPAVRSLKIVVVPAHTVGLPNMAVGCRFTVTMVVT